MVVVEALCFLLRGIGFDGMYTRRGALLPFNTEGCIFDETPGIVEINQERLNIKQTGILSGTSHQNPDIHSACMTQVDSSRLGFDSEVDRSRVRDSTRLDLSQLHKVDLAGRSRRSRQHYCSANGDRSGAGFWAEGLCGTPGVVASPHCRRIPCAMESVGGDGGPRCDAPRQLSSSRSAGRRVRFSTELGSGGTGDRGWVGDGGRQRQGPEHCSRGRDGGGIAGQAAGNERRAGSGNP
ncbi:hypothetical protein B0H14DRAFT_2609506 [Mycena olivaceomarginata]|nr:hypothetical protein B0H14DRAFT_2609506 [Mycena olivaceomarginata]